MRGSLVHDALYQLMRERHLDRQIYLRPVSNIPLFGDADQRPGRDIRMPVMVRMHEFVITSGQWIAVCCENINRD